MRYFFMRLYLILFLLFSNNTLCETRYVLSNSLAGFFSVFNFVLGVLDKYESSREIVGIEVNFRDHGLYYDKTKGENWWQYYFEPIKISKGNFDSIKVQEFPDNQYANFALFTQYDMSRKRGKELIERYVHLKPHVQKRVDSFVENNFKNYNVIGVHYRGTNKVEEAPIVPYEKVYSSIKAENFNVENTKIFVATEDGCFLDFMKIKFPGQVIFLDAIRSYAGEALYLTQKNNKYKFGEDAIVDCVLLSKCSKLYKTASNLSDVSIKFNSNIPFVNLSAHYGH